MSCQPPEEALSRSSLGSFSRYQKRRRAKTACDRSKSRSRPGNDTTWTGAVSLRTAQPSHTACRSTLGRVASNRSLPMLTTYTTRFGLRRASIASTTFSYSGGPYVGTPALTTFAPWSNGSSRALAVSPSSTPSPNTCESPTTSTSSSEGGGSSAPRSPSEFTRTVVTGLPPNDSRMVDRGRRRTPSTGSGSKTLRWGNAPWSRTRKAISLSARPTTRPARARIEYASPLRIGRILARLSSFWQAPPPRDRSTGRRERGTVRRGIGMGTGAGQGHRTTAAARWRGGRGELGVMATLPATSARRVPSAPSGERSLRRRVAPLRRCKGITSLVIRGRLLFAQRVPERSSAPEVTS